ncbi:IDEAL domain-containing protein [Planococcus sp. N028]|uniref:IDEAL domain-containing protein n=1 Tax=Planococcus shixiaomingii TaxID=3058393 RepID=A0ABT8N6X2_9BACL|nr:MULTISPECIES: IDEAL domain-containing protein [unclassified Planococcus (in: firmicutes)]MDN7243484.1 IDEAL domain-containing protein [Planococcus sp. N028]WKA55928.1 IDEAL domain-containing protein [Planococcus sp. N022]
MENYYSYADFMKAMAQTKKITEAEKLLNDIYLDLFLKHVHRSQQEEQLIALIDEALDSNNREAFNTYSTQLQALKQEEEA